MHCKTGNVLSMLNVHNYYYRKCEVYIKKNVIKCLTSYQIF